MTILLWVLWYFLNNHTNKLKVRDLRYYFMEFKNPFCELLRWLTFSNMASNLKVQITIIVMFSDFTQNFKSFSFFSIFYKLTRLRVKGT